jgi:hypothetical protein
MQENNIRDGMIHQAQQERMERDVKIMQKVNHAHREAFRQKFPGQVEHCLRLTVERLQKGLSKEADMQISDRDCHDLAVALEKLFALYQQVNYQEQ